MGRAEALTATVSQPKRDGRQSSPSRSQEAFSELREPFHDGAEPEEEQVSPSRSLKEKNHEDDAPAQKKLTRKEFESELRKLQVELVRLQTWVQATKAKIIVVFEGRDTAGKGGVISRITQRVSPRVFRHIALPAPTEREKSQLYVQRYMAQFPAGGEVALFDRSWYNRAGVERVMGFCSKEQYERFIHLVCPFERELVRNGIILLKYFLDVSQDEQRRRFTARIEDPVKHWKLSPMDTESVRLWWDYTQAYQDMLRDTDMPECPWYVVQADNKRQARLNLIAHMLSQIPYKKVKIDLPKVPKAEPRPKGVEATLSSTHVVPEVY
jgi:polyphosphate kinase 2